MLTRRKLIRDTLTLSAGLAAGSGAAAFADANAAIHIKRAQAVPVKLAPNFVGLGYEMSSVAPLGLLSPDNNRYVALVRGLGAPGVLRVGGIVADYTSYEPNGVITAERQHTVITEQSIKQFAAFLRKIGWTAIWSVNFAQGSIEEAVAEARAVVSILGPQLLALEIGNEVENYARGDHAFRKPPYSYEAYRKEFDQWHNAIAQAVPNTHFAAPDTASSVEWVERMAEDARGDVQLLTTHYYRNGQRRGSAEQLLTPDPRLIDVLARLRTVSNRTGIPWRMCETNSFSGGGLPDVSDTFIGALWTLDFMLLLALYGCAGVNIETGVNQLGFISFYSPVQDDGKGLNTAGVPYYGMLAFAAAAADANEILPIEFDAQGIALTAYVLGKENKPCAVVAVNRDATRDARLSISELKIAGACVMRLNSPAEDSKAGITFGGTTVTPDGTWKPVNLEPVHNATVAIPRMSAAVIRPRKSG
jgi:hypothetical protein